MLSSYDKNNKNYKHEILKVSYFKKKKRKKRGKAYYVLIPLSLRVCSYSKVKSVTHFINEPGLRVYCILKTYSDLEISNSNRLTLSSSSQALRES